MLAARDSPRTEDVHVRGEAGEEDGGLPGGVAAARTVVPSSSVNT